MSDVIDDPGRFGPPADLQPVLASAARLQQVVPDAVPVGGSVAAAYAGHPFRSITTMSSNVRSVMRPCRNRSRRPRAGRTGVRAAKPPMTIMGCLGGIEAGLRQLHRKVPLETVIAELPDGRPIRIPTIDEALRVKAHLVVQRNQVRDYVDVAALADRIGIPPASRVLAGIDGSYDDRSDDDESVVVGKACGVIPPVQRRARSSRRE